MERRKFIKNSIATSTGLMLLPSYIKLDLTTNEQALNELEKYFINPPSSASPWCFWMWMNGNITKEGITADLEAMKRMGIGGVINFNSAVGIPRGPVDYASNEWMEATAHAVREAQRLEIAFSIHNSPGYSGCGGPWITPEMSMQQLVWTETLLNSNGNVDIQLQKPYAKHGYYRDAFIIAYPSLPVEKVLMRDKLARVQLDGKEIDKQIILDKNPETKVRLEITDNTKLSNDTNAYDVSFETSDKNTLANSSKGSSLVLEFAEPFEARAITIYRKAEIPGDLFDGPRDHPTPFKLEISNDNINYKLIGTVRPPELREMNTPASLSFPAIKANYFRLSVAANSWLSEVELHNGPRLAGWPGKTNCTHGDSSGETPVIEEDNIIKQSSIIDITNRIDSNGQLKWNAPTGRWTILRIGHTTTGENCSAHPDAGAGLEIDKFRKDALQLHFDRFLDKFINKVKPYVGKSFKAITVDSYEAGKQNWTINFPGEFRKQKNYDIMGWLPAMTGRIVGSIEETERFLWDVRKVQANLLSENFYGHYKKLCRDRGLEFYAEPYGDGNIDSLQIGQYLDQPMSEFWTRHIYGSDITSIQAASIAHTYGKKIASAESFTAMPATAKWTDYPYSLKAEGDYFFSIGVNRLIFHTFVHQPYMTGKPGMTMGPFGIRIDRNNTWTEQAYGWTKYLQRSQYLLQQGISIVDVCFFSGDNPESGVPDIYRFLPMGYKGDVVGAGVLHDRLKIENGKIVLPDGMDYKLMVMSSQDMILDSSLKKIKDLVNEGMVLLTTNKNFKAYGNSSDKDVQTLAKELFGNLDGDKIKERSLGKGKVIWYNNLKEGLERLRIQPDFDYTSESDDAAIHYAHKIVGTDEFYFVNNHKRKREKVVCSFRTQNKKPELWNAETGTITDVILYSAESGRTFLPLTLEPSSSVFVIFRNKTEEKPLYEIYKDGKALLSLQRFTLTPDKYADVTNNFTISLWAKPDSFAHSGRSLLFHAPQGKAVYGDNHSAIAMGMGQNGIKVYERHTGSHQSVLEYSKPIEGWTHVVLQYKSSVPNLYVDGKLVVTGKASKFIVHPGIDTPATQEQFTTYFEGNFTTPQLYNSLLSEIDIVGIFKKGIPDPDLPAGLDMLTDNGKTKALFWENGLYSYQSVAENKIMGDISGCRLIDLNNEWQIKFPKESGIGSEIVLPSLISLHKHKDFNVRHFSGTCTYNKIIPVAQNDLLPGKKLFLHLGRVEVVAELKVNRTKVGLLWKEPFIVDITKQVKVGKNLLEIAVTNLWPNRLIGDEYLPAENEYNEHKFIKEFPEWFSKNQEKPGNRKTFVVWKTHDKNDPLLESGLLGPVKLISAIEKIIC